MSSSAITGPVFSDARRAPSGTAAAPSFAFNDSTGTGVYLVSAGVLGLSTAGVQRVVVDASGNVGIGTASPQDKMHISSGSGGSITLQGQYEFGAENYNLRLLNDGTTRGYLSQLPAAGGMQLAEGQTYSGSGNYRADGTTAAAINMQGGIITFTTNSGLVAAGLFSPTERARIDASGNLLVGKTSANVTVTGVELRTSGEGLFSSANTNNMNFYNTTAGAYRFFVSAAGQINATSTSITAISDISLKENVRDLETGLSQVLALKPRRFDWKAETLIDEKNVAGFIAQEVEEILPELVYDYKYNEDVTKKALKMGDMVPTLVKAIQEQQEIIGKLEARLAALESK